MRPYADLFFMGAAFLLLETKNVATFAMLFGTTWLVNALVFAGVLVIVLAAVETDETGAHAKPAGGLRRHRAVVGGGVRRPTRLAAATAVRAATGGRGAAGVPADLPGQHRLRQAVQAEAADSQAAFAINIIGAIVGGCLEYAALLTGYGNLLIVVGVIYGLAFTLKPRMSTAALS